MASPNSDGNRSLNIDENISFMRSTTSNLDYGSPLKRLQTAKDQTEMLTQLRRENFDLRILCHRFEQIYGKGQHIFQLEDANKQLTEQLKEKANLLFNASKMLTSLKNENEQLKSDHEDVLMKIQSVEKEWRLKYDALAKDYENLRASHRQAESRCELVENESYRRENVNRAEISLLRQKLTDAEERIAVLQADVDVYTSIQRSRHSPAATNASLPLSPCYGDKENICYHPLESLLEPLSPTKLDDVELIRQRYSSAQQMIRQLKDNCDSVTQELEICKQQLAASESKLHLVTEQLESEKALHRNHLAEKNSSEQALFKRINEISIDRNYRLKCNDALESQLKQLREFNERIKKEHLQQLVRLDQVLQERDRTIYELSTVLSNLQDEVAQIHTIAPLKASAVVCNSDLPPLCDVTQIHHSDSSHIWDETTAAVAVDAAVGTTQVVEEAEGESEEQLVARLQREISTLKSRLASQARNNARLKTAYNALAHSTVKAPVGLADISQSVHPSLLEDLNMTRASVAESSLCLSGIFNQTADRSNAFQRASVVLDKTVSELQQTLGRIENEISAAQEVETQKSRHSISPKDEEVDEAGSSASAQSLERLKGLHTLIKNLLNQFDNMRVMQRSFHETAVNCSLMAAVSTAPAPQTSEEPQRPEENERPQRQTSSSFLAAGGAGEISAIFPGREEIDEVSETTTSLSQARNNNNNTLNALLDIANMTSQDGCLSDADFSCASLRLLNQQLGDVSRIEVHNRSVFDRVAAAMARIKDAVDSISVQAAIEVLMALFSSSSGDVDAASALHSPAFVDATLALVMRFAKVMAQATEGLGEAGSGELSDWQKAARQWFVSLMDVLRRSVEEPDALEALEPNLAELEQRYIAEFLDVDQVKESALKASGSENKSEALEEALTDAQSQVAELQARVVDREHDLEDTENKLVVAEGLLSSLKSELDELKARSADREEVLRETEDKLEQTETRLLALATEVDELKASLKARDDEMQHLREELEGALAETQLLAARLQASESEMKAMATERERAKSKEVDHYRTLLEVAETKLASSQKECERLTAVEADLMAELEDREVQLVTLQSNLEAVRSTAAGAQVRLLFNNQKTSPIREEAEEAPRQQQQPAPTEKEESDLRKQLKQREEKYQAVRAVAFSLKAKVEQERRRCAEVTAERKRLTKLLAENERRVKGFVAELERLGQAIAAKNRQIKRLEDLVSSAPSDLKSRVSLGTAASDKLQSALVPGVTSGASETPCDKPDTQNVTYSLPACVDGMTSLIANIGATVRELSSRLDATIEDNAASETADATQTRGADRAVADDDDDASDFGSRDADPSSAFNDLLNNQTPSSLNSVSLGQQHSTFVAISQLKDYLDQCSGQLTGLFGALLSQLQCLLATIQASSTPGAVDSTGSTKVRNLIQHCLTTLGPVAARHPNNPVISHVVQCLSEAESLLCQQTSPAKAADEGDGVTSTLTTAAGRGEVETLTPAAAAGPETATGSASCSCSCRRKCSRMAASIQAVNAILNKTAEVLSGRDSARSSPSNSRSETAAAQRRMSGKGGDVPSPSYRADDGDRSYPSFRY